MGYGNLASNSESDICNMVKFSNHSVEAYHLNLSAWQITSSFNIILLQLSLWLSVYNQITRFFFLHFLPSGPLVARGGGGGGGGFIRTPEPPWLRACCLLGVLTSKKTKQKTSQTGPVSWQAKERKGGGGAVHRTPWTLVACHKLL